MKRVGSRKFLGRVAGTVTLLAAPLGVIDRAHGACDQTAPVNNTTVTCSGTTTDANPPNGWGTGVETGDTIIVQAGASVSTTTATGIGILLLNGTVNNLGTITGGAQGFGIDAADLINGITVNNSGIIGGAVGIFGSNSVNVVNDAAASISGATFGILSQAPIINAINVTNSGKIEATGTAAGTAGIAIGTSGTATVNNLSGGIIAANGQNGTAILGQAVIVTGNAGTIEAGIGAGITGGVAIKADTPGGTADVTNSNVIQASSIAIVTDGLLTLNNTGLVTSGGSFAVLSNNGDVNVNQNVAGSTGTISAIAVGGIAIQAAGTATVTNNGDGVTTGIITADSNAIFANAVNVTNTGLIQAKNANSFAIQAANGTATVSNSGDGVTTGIITAGNTAIFATNAVNVTNTGLI